MKSKPLLLVALMLCLNGVASAEVVFVNGWFTGTADTIIYNASYNAYYDSLDAGISQTGTSSIYGTVTHFLITPDVGTTSFSEFNTGVTFSFTDGSLVALNLAGAPNGFDSVNAATDDFTAWINASTFMPSVFMLGFDGNEAGLRFASELKGGGSISAIPEPSTYAALASLAALAYATLRRRYRFPGH